MSRKKIESTFDNSELLKKAAQDRIDYFRDKEEIAEREKKFKEANENWEEQKRIEILETEDQIKELEFQNRVLENQIEQNKYKINSLKSAIDEIKYRRKSPNSEY